MSVPFLPSGLKLSAAMIASAALLLGASAALATAPGNDSFANATELTVAALPFGETVDVTEATVESGEPYAYCSYSYQSIWYKITPATDVWLSAQAVHSYYGGSLNVWKDNGSGITGISLVKCSDSNGSTFKAVGGTTYYLQAMAPCCYVSGTLRVDVAQVPAPVPVTEFYYYPSDPSTFDRIQFYDSSYDPGGVGFRSRVWDFGDRGTGSPPDSGGGGQAHQYANDGDYLVTLTVTTLDDRTASVSHTVQVRTHDVGITKFKVPESASSGQTRQISVGIRNTRYPETVQVTLEVSVPGSYFGPVGILQQYVPVRASNRTTDFSFNYTFTSNDASIGKAVFRATASMYPARDALPADNVAISLPTKVSKLGASEAVGGDLAAPQSGVQLALLGVRPNPARAGADLLIRLSLPSGGGSAKLQLVDLAGRMVTQREVGSLGAGTHEVRLGWGHKVTPGIYWMRLSQGDKSLTTRVTLR